MKVSDVMTAPVRSCRPEDRDNLAAQLMWENDCGVLPVVDDSGRAVGVVTDRDLCMAAYTRGRALADLFVGEAMSGEIFGCAEEDSIEDALRVMKEHRVRRLPVLDSEAHPIGLLSMNDVVRAVQREGKGRKTESVVSTLLGTLGAVCEPRLDAKAELVPPVKPGGAGNKDRPSKIRS